MKNFGKSQIITPKYTILGENSTRIFNERSSLRSVQSKLIDLIPLNRTILLDCPRREKID